MFWICFIFSDVSTLRLNCQYCFLQQNSELAFQAFFQVEKFKVGIEVSNFEVLTRCVGSNCANNFFDLRYFFVEWLWRDFSWSGRDVKIWICEMIRVKKLLQQMWQRYRSKKYGSTRDHNLLQFSWYCELTHVKWTNTYTDVPSCFCEQVTRLILDNVVFFLIFNCFNLQIISATVFIPTWFV